MKARQSFRYANKQLSAGEVFEAESMHDALLLEHGGQARRDVSEATEKRAYKRRDMRADH